jgi:2-methylcitrate dehydratase
VVVELKDSRSIACERSNWLGFFNRPMSWEEVRQKFDALTTPHTAATQRDEVAEIVATLEDVRVRSLAACLGTIGTEQRLRRVC